jgi:hypothetical protein
VIGLLALPFFLHKKWRVARRIIIHAKPGAIFPHLNDLRNWPLWTEWARRGEMQFSHGGPESGVGAVQFWDTGRLNGVLKIVQSHPDERIAYELDVQAGKYRLDGAIALEPIGESTRVTWMCRWESGSNPYSRYLDLYCKWRLNHDFEAGLENLRDLVENPSRA